MSGVLPVIRSYPVLSLRPRGINGIMLAWCSRPKHHSVWEYIASHFWLPSVSDGNVNMLQLIPCRCVRVINMIISYYVLINNRMAIKTNCHIRIEVHRDADIRTESAELIGCHQVRVDGDRDDEYGSAIYRWRMSFALTFLSFLWRWVSQHKVIRRRAVVWSVVTRRAR